MNDGDHRDEIVRLEAQIDELAARIENCRKFILAGRIAVVGGGVVLIATVGRRDPVRSVDYGGRGRGGARRHRRCGLEPQHRE